MAGHDWYDGTHQETRCTRRVAEEPANQPMDTEEPRRRSEKRKGGGGGDEAGRSQGSVVYNNSRIIIVIDDMCTIIFLPLKKTYTCRIHSPYTYLTREVVRGAGVGPEPTWISV